MKEHHTTLQATATLLREKLNKRVLTVKETGITTNRNINHWQSEGLIQEYREGKNRWRRFSMLEVLWLSIIKNLRSIGISHAFIKKTQGGLFTLVHSDLVPAKETIPVFEHFLLKTILLSAPAHIVIDKEGNASMLDEDKFLNKAGKQELHFHQSISMMELVKSNFPELYFISENVKNPDLSPEETALIATIRTKGFQSIRIKMKDGKMDMIEGVESVNAQRKIIDLLKEGEYQDIELKQENGKIVHVKRTIKKKL